MDNASELDIKLAAAHNELANITGTIKTLHDLAEHSQRQISILETQRTLLPVMSENISKEAKKFSDLNRRLVEGFWKQEEDAAVRKEFSGMLNRMSPALVSNGWHMHDSANIRTNFTIVLPESINEDFLRGVHRAARIIRAAGLNPKFFIRESGSKHDNCIVHVVGRKLDRAGIIYSLAGEADEETAVGLAAALAESRQSRFAVRP